jgi:CRP-like cAMP-binding protein
MADNQSTDSASAASTARTRSLAESPALAKLAAELLQTPSMLAGMGDAELGCVVSYLRLVSFGASTTLFRQGDDSNTGYLLLILSGDVRVEANLFAEGDTVDVSVLGPGDVIGEMGLIDGAPRASTCLAVSAVHAAALSRKAFDLMLAEHPAAAAKLMIALAKRLADRLRAMAEQLGLYAKLAQDAKLELQRLTGLPGR